MGVNRVLRMIALGAVIAHLPCLAIVSPAAAHEVGIPSRWATDELTNRMKRVQSGVADQRLTLQEMEEEHLKLLKEFGSPREKGRIFAQMTHLFLQGKDKDSDKAIKYATLALQQPLGVMDAILMNTDLGSGLAIKHHGRKGKDYAGPRRQILAANLRALKVVLDNLTQSEVKPLPTGMHHTYFGPDSDLVRNQRKHEEAEAAERDRIMTQNELIGYRDDLVFRCASMHVFPGHGLPADPAELERMAREILTPAHEDVTREIMKKVNAAIKNGYITTPSGGKMTTPSEGKIKITPP